MDDEPFEEDDEVNTNENNELEGEESEIEAESQKSQTDFNTDLVLGVSSSANMTKHTNDLCVAESTLDGKKEFRVKKKKSILKKKPSAKSKKSEHGGYREDAEENKTWC